MTDQPQNPEPVSERRAALVEDFRRGGRRPERAAERSRGGGRDERPDQLETRD